MERPLVSVIVPIYNAQSWLERSLRSVALLDYSNLEILLIDDGSVDRSGEICLDFAGCDQRFRYFRQENKGVSEARNRGLAEAKGEYLQFVDSDDVVCSHFLKTMLTRMQETGADLVICDYWQDDERNGLEDMEHFALGDGVYTRRRYLWRISRGPASPYVGVLWNKLYKASRIRENGLSFPRDVSLGEDFIFNMEYLLCSETICSIRERLYHYQWRSESSLCGRTRPEPVYVQERLRLYHAYEDTYRREGIDRTWRLLMLKYIFNQYYGRLKYLGTEARQYRPLLYQSFIRGTGMKWWEFLLLQVIKRSRELLRRGA